MVHFAKSEFGGYRMLTLMPSCLVIASQKHTLFTLKNIETQIPACFTGKFQLPASSSYRISLVTKSEFGGYRMLTLVLSCRFIKIHVFYTKKNKNSNYSSFHG
jgi:hypothetical protein